MSRVRRMGPAVRPLVASLALGLGVLMPMDARAQATPAAVSIDSTAVGAQVPATEPQPAVSQAPQGSGLPRYAPPPRTLRAFWPVFALLALGWIGMMGYLLRAGAAFGRIVDGVRHLAPDRAGE